MAEGLERRFAALPAVPFAARQNLVRPPVVITAGEGQEMLVFKIPFEDIGHGNGFAGEGAAAKLRLFGEVFPQTERLFEVTGDADHDFIGGAVDFNHGIDQFTHLVETDMEGRVVDPAVISFRELFVLVVIAAANDAVRKSLPVIGQVMMPLACRGFRGPVAGQSRRFMEFMSLLKPGHHLQDRFLAEGAIAVTDAYTVIIL